MKILLVADGRSPITNGWIQLLKEAGCDISLVSTFPCNPIDGLDEMRIIPTAFSSMAGSQAGDRASKKTSRLRRFVSQFRDVFMTGRYYLGPLSLGSSRQIFLDYLRRIKPDIVHALRIPYEGMVARVTPVGIPLAISIWGNDLTLHAHGSPLMSRETRLTLQRADGLMADAHRDLDLAARWGLHSATPLLFVPGGGGIDLTAINRAVDKQEHLPVEIPENVPVVINPRGFRPGSVRNDTFFKAIPAVLQEKPDTVFICAGMAGQPEALKWMADLEIESSIKLLPFLPQEDLWRLFKRSQVTVSVSQHDGTPNSLLEAMSIGCYPVVGDIASTREWITDGENGSLVSPDNPSDVSRAILKVLNDPALKEKAAVKNSEIIRKQAVRQNIAHGVKSFYETLLKHDSDSEQRM